MLLVATVLSLIALVYIVVQSVFRPLDHVVSTMFSIGEGDGKLSSRLDESGNTEITQLARGFNLFAGNIENVVTNVSCAVKDISIASTDLSHTATETDSAIREQKSQIDHVSSSVHAVLGTIQSVSLRASEAAQAANRSDEEASSGLETVVTMSESIDNLSREIKAASDTITKVEGDSNTIATVLDVIHSIADQTNLLALNAAIEAARAGEQGRGFAVVAEEVRSLAQRTQNSTIEIQRMVESLQSNAQQAVSVMGVSQEKANECVSYAGEAGNVIKNISASIAEITTMNTQIADASQEQNAVLEGINKRMTDIFNKTEQIAQGARQTAKSSDDTQQQSEQLRRLVKQFNV